LRGTFSTWDGKFVKISLDAIHYVIQDSVD